MFLVWTFLPQRPAPVVGAFEQHLVKSRYRPTIRASKAETPRVWGARGGGSTQHSPAATASTNVITTTFPGGRGGGWIGSDPSFRFNPENPPPLPKRRSLSHRQHDWTRFSLQTHKTTRPHRPPPSSPLFFFLKKINK